MGFTPKATACAKHFAVHSGPEARRHDFDACPSKEDFRETYLPAFEACVREGRVEAVMGAYNRVYGESASVSRLLLKDILRGEWGFTGHIVSDCGAVCDIWKSHKIVRTPPEAAALAIRNGLTFECGPCFRHLKTALEKGFVKEKEVDEALVTLFTTRYRLGIMEDDPDCPYKGGDPACICSAAHRALARKIARESMVLLKNGGTLPLDPRQGSYTVIGAGATDIFSLMGNYYGVADRYVSYLKNEGTDPLRGDCCGEMKSAARRARRPSPQSGVGVNTDLRGPRKFPDERRGQLQFHHGSCRKEKIHIFVSVPQNLIHLPRLPHP